MDLECTISLRSLSTTGIYGYRFLSQYCNDHTASMVLGDKGQDTEEEEEREDSSDCGGDIFSTVMIESIQNQVTIF